MLNCEPVNSWSGSLATVKDLVTPFCVAAVPMSSCDPSRAPPSDDTFVCRLTGRLRGEGAPLFRIQFPEVETLYPMTRA